VQRIACLVTSTYAQNTTTNRYLKFLNLSFVSLICDRNISYSKNAATLTERETCTNLRRIQRFFTEFSIDFDVIVRLLVAIIPLKGPYQLSLDRTN
jgi:hypothetical protein